MDATGAPDECIAGIVEWATGGSGTASEHVGGTYIGRHSMGCAIGLSHVDCVAIPYW